MTPKAEHTGLTKRELEVIQLLSRGLQAKEIANLLSISTRTVQGHVKKIHQVLGVSTSTGAVAVEIREGLID